MAQIIDGRAIVPGDVLLGLASSGAHSNGFSLIRRILERGKPPFDPLEPTRIYVKPVLKLMESVKVKGLAHITGGGVVGNVPRMLPKNVVAKINKSAWERPDVFKWLQQTGNVAEDEMWRVFNCGIGMVAAVARADVQAARALLEREGERVYEIGTIEKSSGEPDAVIV